jgi:hypothetical protein
MLAKLAYYPYQEVSKRIIVKSPQSTAKDISVDSVAVGEVAEDLPAASTKKKGLLNRKDNWESLQTKMLDVQRLREEEKKKQNL